MIQASRLVLGVFGANVFLNLGNLHSLIMHFPRIEGDVLTDIACGTVLVLEAKQIVLMAEIHHASAETRELFQDFRNVFCDLISGTRLGVGEKRG